MTGALVGFHPHVRAWFEATFRAPTDVQRKSWPAIAAGRHALITAPTGSGKTLTAFLWALDALATGRYAPGATRVLYISPLKALNNDVQRNLLQPLEGLRARFAAANDPFPPIRVLVRSGDTPSGERQRMLRTPPEILITTPESLTLLLTTARGRQALASVETVILDEIHAVADNRRGTVLMTCLERLVHIAGDVQRIALSATVNPLDDIAAFVAGLDERREPRPIDIVVGTDPKKIDFTVRFPEHVRAAQENGQKIWAALAESFKGIIAANDSTLFFTNSRRLAERITLTINDSQREPLAYAHHGSLSREIRTEVEARLKSGAMRAIVATNSLEMGIDVGSIDEVVMIQSPPSITAALQRIGRAGHRVGDTSKGTLFPTHAHDFVEAAALSECIETRALEPLTTLDNALDVLAQIIVSMTASETWRVDALFDLLRRSYPYRSLPREQFDLVVEMLAGRYAGSRVRDLKARVVFDRIDHTLRAAKGAVYALYNSGGTIPDRGYYHLRHLDTGALVGDLDEEFVWEAIVGQIFSLGSQHWQIKHITHNDVLAVPAKTPSSAPPFWRAEGYNRSFFYSNHIGEFLERTEQLLEIGKHAEFSADLTQRHGFDAAAAQELIAYLDRQRTHTGAPLPHRRHVLVEHVRSGPDGYRAPDEEHQIVLHTGWGGRVNRPYALALSVAWERTYGEVPELHVDNNAVVIQTKAVADPARVIDLVRAEEVDQLLRSALEHSGFFGARFRECAGRALLVTRQRFNQRMPLWMSRLHAKKLLTTVKQYADFPVLLETYRTCLVDEFDMPALRGVLAELADHEIAVTEVVTNTPSPFASNIAWGQITRYMYADDSPESADSSALSDDLIRSAVFDAGMRPRLSETVVASFVAKRQRTAPGYAPVDAIDLGEWLKERVLIPEPEWRGLAAIVGGTDVPVHWLAQAGRRWAVHPELARVVTERLLEESATELADVADPRDRTQLVAEFLTFYGPLERAAIGELLPLRGSDLDVVLAELVDEGALVAGHLITASDATHYCDADNLEILLRLQRAARRNPLEPRPLLDLPDFFATWQRFGSASSAAALGDTLDRLRGVTADVEVWLNDLVEARHTNVDARLLDEVLAVDGFVWLGRAREVITVMPMEDLGLLDAPPVEPMPLAAAFKDRHARYGFFQLADAAAESLATFSNTLWENVWAGTVTADSFAALRAGNTRQYRLDTLPPAPQPAGRHRSGARRRGPGASPGWPGNWFLLPGRTDNADVDALSSLEAAKDRARILLDRYGVVCREFANREGGPFRWAALFRALRIMELSGEVVAGLFFNGLSGPQFAVPAAVRQLERGRTAASFWVNATDPIAPCGLGIEWPTLVLPQRRASNYLAFHRGVLVLVVENYGRRLSFGNDLDDNAFASATALLTHLLAKRRKITIDSIDGANSADSPLLMRLADVFDVARDHRGVDLLFPAQRIG